MQVGDDEVLTLKQAAQRLGLSAETLRLQVRAGKMHATLAGKTYLVTATEVARYDRQRKQPRGFANPDHPLYGKRGGGGRRKKDV
jgi:excisionase family DNA binding protein